MDLSSLFQEYPQIRPRKSGDAESLFEILEKHPMRVGGLELIYDRRPHFEALLKHQAPHFETLVLDHQGRIDCFFSRSWGPRLVAGVVKNVAYIGDFRVRDHRTAARLWRDFYPRWLKLLTAGGSPVDFCLTAILEGNLEARQSLVKHGPRFGFYYHPLKSQIMVNLIAKKIWARENSSVTVVNATVADEPALRELLDQNQREKIAGFVFQGENSEWEHRRSQWVGWRLEDFWLVKRGDQIVACTLPWSPTPVKRMRVRRVPAVMKVALRLGQVLGLALPREQESLETRYLTHLAWAPDLQETERTPLLQAFAARAFAERTQTPFHLLSFATESPETAQALENSFVLQRTNVNLFEVSANSKPSFAPDVSVGFEMGLV